MKMRNKRGLILGTIILFLLILPNVNAVAPITSIVTQFDEGLAIDYQAFPVGAINKGFSLQIHVYNLSNGLIISEPLASCRGHLFSNNGSLIEEQQAKAEDGYFTFSSNKYNITTEGYYSYSIHCNTSYLGGYSSNGFLATADGKLYNQIPFSIGIGIILIGVLFFILYLANSLAKEHALLKLFLSSMCVFLVAPLLWIAETIADFYSTTIANLIYLIFWGYSIIIFVFAFYLVIAFFIWLFKILLKIKFDKDVEDDE